MREALLDTGDIIPGHGMLLIRLDPLTTRRRTRALAALCEQASQARLAAIKEMPSHAEFIAKSCEGNRPIPQSFPVRMQSSTLASTPCAASM